MGVNMRKEAEVKVFLKCLICGTFVTSPSFTAIKKHIDNCQQSKLTSRLQGANENVTFDLECDSIDEQMETVTFFQPSLVLPKCKMKQRQRGRIPRNSHVEASKTLSRIIKLEYTASNIKRDKEWNLENDQDNLVTVTTPNKVKIAIPKGRFDCDMCTARCRTEAFLERHKKTVHTAKPGEIVTCPICRRMIKRFHGIAGLHSHLNQHENAEALEKKYDLWRQWPVIPNRKKGNTAFNCKYCFTPHRNHRSFLSHMATDHPGIGEHSLLQCSYHCSTQFDSMKDLIAHFKSAHPIEYFGCPVEDFKIVNGKRHLKCDICGKFIYTWTKSAHMETHLNKNKKITIGKYGCAYRDCGIKCSTIELLKRHFVYHLEKNPYVCNFPGCSAKADGPSHLRRHMKLQHLDAPPICPKCGVTYISRCQLKNHRCQDNIDKLKSGRYKIVEIRGLRRLRPAKSSIGDKKLPLDPRFISTPRLVKYDPTDKVNQYIESLKQIDINALIRSDPGFIRACKDNPGFGELILGYQYFGGKFRSFQKKQKSVYQCSKCPTMFYELFGFNKHKAQCKGSDIDSAESSKVIRVNTVNMLPLGEKPLQIGCSACGKPFESEELLEKHLKEDHRPGDIFKCDVPGCGTYFPSAGNKNMHFQRVHINRPYQCEQCKLRFVSQRTLDKHLEEHRSNPDLGANKSPRCDLCGKVLADFHSRRRHLQLMHGISIPLPDRQCKLTQKKKIVTKKKNH